MPNKDILYERIQQTHSRIEPPATSTQIFNSYCKKKTTYRNDCTQGLIIEALTRTLALFVFVYCTYTQTCRYTQVRVCTTPSRHTFFVAKQQQQQPFKVPDMLALQMMFLFTAANHPTIHPSIYYFYLK